MKILIADDHAVLRAGLRLLLQSQSDMEVVGEAADAESALAEVVRLQPEVVVLDLSMPGGGLQLIANLKERAPKSRVLVLTMHDDASTFRSALAHGADGFVTKSSADSELLVALRTVHQGRSFFTGAVSAAAEAGPDGPRDDLSPREQEVLRLLAAGNTNKEIAQQLSLSVKTVETYRARIGEKSGARSRADLVRYAVRLGLFSPR